MFIYARSMEKSTNPTNRFKAPSLYSSLYLLCKATKPTSVIHPTKTFQEWLRDPVTWHVFGHDYFSQANEPLLAREAYSACQEKTEALLAAGVAVDEEVEPDYGVLQTLQFYFNMSKNALELQNIELAIEYAEKALEKDHFNSELRAYLASLSKPHATLFDVEVQAVRRFRQGWKERAWTDGFRSRLKDQLIAELERSYAKDPYNLHVRGRLAYYAREMYRYRFLFEEKCAVRIQRSYRLSKQRWDWKIPLRQRYVELANQTESAFQQSPYSLGVRTEVIRVARSSLCPKTHRISTVSLPRLLLEDESLRKIIRAFRASRWRRMISEALQRIRVRRMQVLMKYAVIIQRYARRYQAKLKLIALRIEYARFLKNAITAQNVVRKYLAVKELRRRRRALQMTRRREAAIQVLRRSLPTLLQRRVGRRRREVLKKERERERLAYEDYMRPPRYSPVMVD